MRRTPWGTSAASAGAPLLPSTLYLGQQMIFAKDTLWGGVKGLHFKQDGVLETPWGMGKWGALPDQGSRVMFADFGGSTHELDFNAFPAFTSTRCSDGAVVRGHVELGASS